MPAEPKPPYRLVVKLDGAKPELIAAALRELRDIASSLDQTGDATATLTIEGYQERPIEHVMGQFEDWLYTNALGLDCDMTIKRPGIRPETLAMRMREKRTTPMDQLLRNGSPVLATIRPGDENLFDDEEAA